jgi:hypothetical protein
MTSTDPEGTCNIGYPHTKEGTAGASTRKNQDLESRESDKLAASVSEAIEAICIVVLSFFPAVANSGFGPLRDDVFKPGQPPFESVRH